MVEPGLLPQPPLEPLASVKGRPTPPSLKLESLKEEIFRIFITEDATLDETIQILRIEHAFCVR